MIELIVLKWLSDKLGIHAYMEEPERPDKEYVLIEKVGSDEENHIQRATITVRSYAESLYNAATLNEEVKQAMKDLIAMDSVTSCQLNSDYNHTDTETKRYRYQAVFDITFYEGENNYGNY